MFKFVSGLAKSYYINVTPVYILETKIFQKTYLKT